MPHEDGEKGKALPFHQLTRFSPLFRVPCKTPLRVQSFIAGLSPSCWQRGSNQAMRFSEDRSDAACRVVCAFCRCPVLARGDAVGAGRELPAHLQTPARPPSNGPRPLNGQPPTYVLHRSWEMLQHSIFHSPLPIRSRCAYRAYPPCAQILHKT